MKRSQDLKPILSLDGGGIKGVTTVIILDKIEQELSKSIGTPEKIQDYLGGIAGTSTGGIIASLLLCQDNDYKFKYSAGDVKDIYLKEGPKVFKRSFWQKLKSFGGLTDEKYSNKNLKKLLHKYLGDTKDTDCKLPFVIPTYKMNNGECIYFINHHTYPPMHIKLKDIALATSAAPTYFEPYEINGSFYIDGGFFANNPSIIANRINKEMDRPVISIGTGFKNISRSFEDFSNRDKLKWIKPVIATLLNANGKDVTNNTPLLYKKNIRIDTLLATASDEMDNVKKDNINNLIKDAEEHVKTAKGAIEKAVKYLKVIVV